MRKFFTIGALVLALALPAHSASRQGPLITLIEENDDLALNGDQHYTQGVKLSYMYGDEKTPDWAFNLAQTLPDLGMRLEAPKFGYALGQNIFTPRNLRTTAPVMDDRPYAGWLYFGMILQKRGKQAGVPVNDTFEVDMGLIGPASFAKQAQEWWHNVGGWPLANGWDNQLKTEPALNLKYDRQWKFGTYSQNLGLELIPHAGLSLGNVYTYAGGGAMVRFGYNIPDDFGVQHIDSLASQTGGRSPETRPFGAYLFAGADGRAVLHNVFLDGNLYHDSVSVDKKPFVADLKCGLVLTFRYFDIAATFVRRTCEYKNQPKCDHFGSISLNAKF